MNEQVRSSFWKWPSLGGTLSLLNANFWVVAFLLQRSGVFANEQPAYLWVPFVCLMLFFSLPFATCLFLPDVGTSPPPAAVEIVGDIVLLVLNSFVWGYGLAWCYRTALCLCGGKRPLNPLASKEDPRDG